jgi:hypothetical protein
MGLQKISTVALAVLFTAACSAPAPPAKTVFDPMTQNLDRARDVQRTVDENAEATRKAVQAQENGDPPP